MSDDNPHSTNGSSGKSWFEKLKLSFSGEPQSKQDLVEVITEAEQRELIDRGAHMRLQLRVTAHQCLCQTLAQSSQPERRVQ